LLRDATRGEYRMILSAMRARADVVALFGDAYQRSAVSRRADGSWVRGDQSAMEEIYVLAETNGSDRFTVLDIIVAVTGKDSRRDRPALRLVPDEG
jgi:hypothetical protein